jgi:hypothetical protein
MLWSWVWRSLSAGEVDDDAAAADVVDDGCSDSSGRSGFRCCSRTGGRTERQGVRLVG